MKVQRKVVEVWKSLSPCERRIVRSRAQVATSAILRSHSKIILSLVAGNPPRAIGKAGLCSTSQVYRVAHRFVQEGPPGLADQREDNGETKADEGYLRWPRIGGFRVDSVRIHGDESWVRFRRLFG